MSVREDGLPGLSEADMKLICGLCGHTWAYHSFLEGDCPNDRTKFYWAGSVTLEQKPKPRECPCGIYRNDCDYHRD